MGKGKRRKSIFCIALVCVIGFFSLRGIETMLSEISSNENREIIFTDASLDMSIEEIIEIEGEPSKSEDKYVLYYDERDYLGREGDGRITLVPGLQSFTWEIFGTKESLDIMFNDIRTRISGKLEEENTLEIVDYTRFCKWQDGDADMRILLLMYKAESEWALELQYFRIG